MEKHPMLLDRQNQYKDVHTKKSNIHIQRNPKIPKTFFIEFEKMIQRFIWKHKKTQIARNILKNRQLLGVITVPDLWTYYRAVVTKTAWHWHRDREEDQWSRIETSEGNPHMHSISSLTCMEDIIISIKDDFVKMTD